MEIFDRNYNGRGYFGDPFNTWLCSRQNLKTLTMTIPAPSFCTLMSPMLLEAQFKLSHLTVKLQDWGLDLISKSIFWDFYAKQSELKTLHVFDYNSSLFEQTEKDFARLNEITIETHYMREYPLHVLLLNKINEVATSLTYKNHAATHYHTMSHRYDSCTVKYVPGNKTAEFVDKKMDTTLLKSIGESWLKVGNFIKTFIFKTVF